jgi:predicted murein hydrolase (TIGR00659 family)
MIASLSLILLCQLAGEVIVRGLGLPMPGPVVGLLFLLLSLLARDRFVALARGPLQQDGVENVSRGLLAHLSLLFVPAGVGVVQKLDLVAEHGIAVAAVLAISVVVTLLVTVATFSRRQPLDVARTERAMSANPFSLWVYLSQSPLLWLTVTLLVYATTDALSLVTHRHPLANPVLHSIWIIGAFLMLTGTSYTTYFGGAQFVHFLLGPATVALAVPLYENRKVVAAAILPMLAALVVGSVTAVVSVVLLAEAVGLPRAVVLSLAPKSVTAGVAMGISESLHADPSLTAVAVVLTGIMGAIIVTPLMNRIGITDFRARGFAVGIAAHGIGTARAFQVDAVAGVFAGIAMSLNALVTSLLVPLAVTLLVR